MLIHSFLCLELEETMKKKSYWKTFTLLKNTGLKAAIALHFHIVLLCTYIIIQYFAKINAKQSPYDTHKLIWATVNTPGEQISSFLYAVRLGRTLELCSHTELSIYTPPWTDRTDTCRTSKSEISSCSLETDEG